MHTYKKSGAAGAGTGSLDYGNPSVGAYVPFNESDVSSVLGFRQITAQIPANLAGLCILLCVVGCF